MGSLLKDELRCGWEALHHRTAGSASDTNRDTTGRSLTSPQLMQQLDPGAVTTPEATSLGGGDVAVEDIASEESRWLTVYTDEAMRLIQAIR